MPTHIVTEPDHTGTHWSTWIEENPGIAFGGDSAARAVQRLHEIIR